MFIHGLFMNGMEMLKLRKHFEKAGYDVHQFHYASTRAETDEIILSLNRLVQSLGSQTINFVCHSMGGLIIRHYIEKYHPDNCGRIITIGTPHKGSEVARAVRMTVLGGWMLGQSPNHGLVSSMPKWHGEYPLASIAGTHGIGLGQLFHHMLRENDGTVTVDETILDGADEHKVFSGSHLGLLLSEKVAEYCLDFIQQDASEPI